MKNYDNEVASMLQRDMRLARLNQGQLATALSLDATPITPQAISIWQTRGRIPKGRLARLREVLGAESEIARASDAELCDGSAPVRTYLRKAVEAPQARVPARPAAEVVTDPLGLRELLPEPMQASVGHQVNFGKGVAFVLSYLSEKVLAMVLTPDDPSGEVLSDLAALAALYPAAQPVLILVQPVGFTTHPKPRFIAGQLNIAFEVVRTPAEAAELLISLENAETH